MNGADNPRPNGATLAQATGDYRQWPAIEPLQEVFAYTWVHRLPEASAPVLVVPDGSIDLQFVDGSWRIAGPDCEPQVECVSAGATVVGFRFRPGCASRWLGVSAHELLNQRPLLEQLWGSRVRRLAEAAEESRDPAALTRAVASLVAHHRPARSSADAFMGTAFALLSGGAPEGTPVVRWLASELGMGERTLRRRFDEHFGYGPKTLERILRYQRFLHLARQAKGRSPAALALEAGYADQSHLNRESRRLARSTPGEVEKLLSITGPSSRSSATSPTGSFGSSSA
ncbi:AraC family transcriptional regulator [Archangium violaceum]|uniref:AraC family transcriptional regulator n=1 Tax=Archangium violaceum TaxID=83451 RepID=UPI00193C5251|nr:helix-turn-helix domain-containing protein [Archangium violaceum]QRK10588.1 AraC family transcriptional regulator [Archangium violaceum]